MGWVFWLQMQCDFLQPWLPRHGGLYPRAMSQDKSFLNCFCQQWGKWQREKTIIHAEFEEVIAFRCSDVTLLTLFPTEIGDILSDWSGVHFLTLEWFQTAGKGDSFGGRWEGLEAAFILIMGLVLIQILVSGITEVYCLCPKCHTVGLEY